MSERTEIARPDRAWFDMTCRAQARRGCWGRPDLWDDAEAEARLRAWRAYRDGKSRALVMLEARTGAWLLWRREDCRGLSRPARLTVTGEGGVEDENPAIYRAGLSRPSPEAELLGRVGAAAVLAGLPAREAQIVARVMAGESQKEVAAALGARHDVVRRSYRRALARLRHCPATAAWLGPGA